jgi:hypothetical protein
MVFISPNFSVQLNDKEFLEYVFRHGTWERYEHPEKGETFTLQVGKFPILSIHNILTERTDAISYVMSELESKHMFALLLARVAKLEYQVKLLSKLVPEGSDG